MKVVGFGLSVLATVGVIVVVGCNVETQASNVICVPDQSNVCTNCPPPSDPSDKQSYAGRHVCSHDGTSFGPCEQCAPVVAVGELTEVPHVPRPIEDLDGGASPVPAEGIDAACAGKLAVIAGKDDPNVTFGYFAVAQTSGFKVFSAAGAPMRSPAAFVPNGTSVLAVYRSKNNAIVSSTLTNGLWSAPAGIPGASSDGAPALATWGTGVKAIFRQSDGYHHVANFEAATGWATAIELVGSTANPPPPGISEPSVVSVGVPGLTGATVMVGYTDSATGLYRQEWKGTAWYTKGIKSTVKSAPFRPQIIAMTAGDFDLISTYVAEDGVLHVATRTSKDMSTVWSADSITNTKALPGGAVNGLGLADGRALVVYRTKEKKGRFMVFDPKKTPSWSDPAPLVDDGDPELASTPQLVRDPCGAEAALAYAVEGGTVALLRFKKDAWKGPYVLDDVPSATYATPVATP